MRGLSLAALFLLLASRSSLAGEECSPGTFQNGASCEACAPGKFSDVAGLSACWDCPEGTFAEREAASKCTGPERGANPRIPKYGYESILLQPNLPVVGEKTSIIVRVANNGDTDAAGVEVALLTTSWGLSFGAWERVGLQTVDVPAGSSEDAVFVHVFHGQGRSSIAAVIQSVATGGNVITADDRGLVAAEILRSDSNFSFSVPLLNNGDVPLVLSTLRVRCLDLSRFLPFECARLATERPPSESSARATAKTSAQVTASTVLVDSLKLWVPRSNLGEDGTIVIPPQTELTAEIEVGELTRMLSEVNDGSRGTDASVDQAQVSKPVWLLLETGDVGGRGLAESHVVLRVQPTDVPTLLNIPKLCCVRSIHDRVELEVMLVTALDEFEEGNIVESLQVLQKFFSVAVLHQCSAHEQSCYEETMDAVIDAARIMARYSGRDQAQDQLLHNADMLELNGLHEEAVRMYMEKAKRDMPPAHRGQESRFLNTHTDFVQLL